MPVEATAIDGLWIVRHPTLEDDRGFFRQTVVTAELEDAVGRPLRWAQHNHARSTPGVLRGFHAEPWDKLITVTHGRVRAVIADIRAGSPTLGAHVAVELGDPPAERVSLFVSAWLGNGYRVLGDTPADYVYSVTRVWEPGLARRTVAWDDPTIAADWGDWSGAGPDTPLLSEVDAAAPSLADALAVPLPHEVDA